MSRVVTGLPYYGGKARLGKWINQFLPWEWDQVYVEPFGGMAGVLHNRDPVKVEIVNDLNDRVINWWLAVRDNYKELGRLVRYTPISRSAFNWVKSNLDNEKITPVRRALAYQITVHQSVISCDGHPTWALKFSASPSGKWWMEPLSRLEILAERMRLVQLENRDALEILDRTKKFSNSLVYCDPPYRTADSGGYRKGCREVDVDALTDILLQQKGHVAISGYGDEWDHLGWVCLRKEYTFRGTHTVSGSNAKVGRRVEKLWVNW